jgi:RNA recognition motif-containing protein
MVPFFSTRRGRSPRLVEKRMVLGGAPRGYPALQTSRQGAACSPKATEADVQAVFAAFGNVAFAKIIKDTASGESRGFGFVEMPDIGQAEAAVAGLAGKDLLGHSLVVKAAHARTR